MKTVLSPSMQHYQDLKKQNPECFLMYRMGDFYEFFFDDAIECASILGITLTARAKIPMSGIPAHQLDHYLHKLIRAGHRVAICDQVGQRKVKGRIVTDREITQIVTPGTVTDTQLLDAKRDCCLLALSRKKKKIGLAWVSLTEGIIRIADDSEDALSTYLGNINPDEILISEYDPLTTQDCSGAITRSEDWSFDPQHGYDQLCHHWHLSALECFDMHKTDLSTGSAYSLFCYIQKTQKTIGKHINQIIREQPEAYLILDDKTRQHLEITESINGKSSTLFSLFDFCTTSPGSRWLKRALNSPFRDACQAKARHDALDWLLLATKKNDKRYHSISSLLKSVADVERITAHLSLNRIRPKEFAALRQTIRQLPGLFECLNDAEAPFLIKHIQSLFLLDNELIHLLENCIAEDPATCLRDGQVIRLGWDSTLDRYRSLLSNQKEYIQQLRDRESEKQGIPSLRIEYNRLQGYYIEVTPSYRDRIPSYYQRKQSLKNSERYTIPELMELEKEIEQAQTLEWDREKELYEHLISSTQPFIKDLQKCGQSLAELDGLCSLSRAAHQNNYVRPEFCPVPHIEAIDMRHPVIEKNVSTFIPNNIQLTPQRQFLMITGPNMGGKSTYMRQTALLVLLAYCGSFVPARWAKVGSIDRIMTRIGASDNLSRGQSTFMVEMSEMSRILRQATSKSLLLIDEIGRGTSTYDGLSLAHAIMKHIIEQNQSLCLFSTHYFELVHSVLTYPRSFNVYAEVEETQEGIAFLHTIKEGVAKKSYGIHVASLAGIPEPVIRNAKKRLKSLEHQNARLNEQKREDASLLFEEEKESEKEKYLEFIDRLLHLPLDDLTPRQALDLLNSWQKEVQENNPPSSDSPFLQKEDEEIYNA